MIAVVIVNWNGRSLLSSCLTSVFEQTPLPGLVFVVDNDSGDGSVPYLRTAWPSVSVLEAGSNLGFSGGNNVGIRAALAAGAESVLLLNNDAQLLPGALQHLHTALQRGGPHTWAAAPKILYRSDPGVIWSAGGRFDWWRGVSLDRGTGEPDRGQYDASGQVAFANACCLLVRSHAFRELGLLDDGYFMYFEDSDFAARLGRAGGQIVYQPAARALHDVHGSSGGVPARPSLLALYYSTRNRWQFISKNAPGPVRRLAGHSFTIASRLVRMVQALVGGRAADAGVIGQALYDAYVRRARGRTYQPTVRAPTGPTGTRGHAKI
jgi:GT2 family glycosyltransferase